MSSLEGVADLMEKFRKLKLLDDGKIIKAGARAAGKIVVQKAQGLIPVNKVSKLHKTYKGRLVSPGFAKRSIRFIAVLSKDKQKVAVSIGVRNEAFYAVEFVERGTSKMGAHPWLRPAFASTLEQQQKAIADYLKSYLEKIAKGPKKLRKVKI